MAHCEKTSETIGQLAARLMHHPDADVRRLAASCLTQLPDRPAGAHAVYNGLAGLGSFLREGPPYDVNALAGPKSAETILDEHYGSR